MGNLQFLGALKESQRLLRGSKWFSFGDPKGITLIYQGHFKGFPEVPRGFKILKRLLQSPETP